ncbi:MAG: helix-turn-helix domain-containing protein [Spirochaetota bacterium]
MLRHIAAALALVFVHRHASLVHDFKKRRKGPAEFIREFRVKLAQELLLGSRAPLKQITDQVGFGSVTHFCSTFKRYTGVSPGEFRRDPSKAQSPEPATW